MGQFSLGYNLLFWDKNEMKLAYLGDAQSNHTLRWVQYFAEAGHSVSLLSFQKMQVVHPKINFIQLTLPARLQGIRYLSTVRKVIRNSLTKIKPDIVHAHYISGYGHFAWLSGFRPYVLTAWGSDLFLDKKRSSTSQLLTRLALTSAALVTADSNDLIRTAKKLGAKPSHIYNIQFGVDTELFRPQLSTADLRQRLKIPEHKKIILSPRGLQPGYNIDQIVRAFALLYAHTQNIHLLIKDFNSPPKFREEIDLLVKELNITGGVSFLNAVAFSELPALHNLADVEVSIPTSDGTPVTVLEAMACGALIVACDVPSLREWITDGENGWLVDPTNLQQIAQAISNALELAPSIRNKIQQKNVEIVMQRGNHQTNMRQVENLYQKIHNSPRDLANE